MSDDRARILVVDDVPENVRLLEAVLEAQGYEVVSASDGHAAPALDTAAGAAVEPYCGRLQGRLDLIG